MSRFSDWRWERRLARAMVKLDKAELDLADEKHHHRMWRNHIGTLPSGQRKFDERLESAERKVSACRARVEFVRRGAS